MEHSPYSEAANAEAYDRLALPIQFAEPAKDLLQFTGATAGQRILDVGSGTGAVAVPAAETVGPTGSVTGLDASIAMLRLLKRKDVCSVVVGKVPDLPFADSLFDVVMASFVVSHFDNYKRGLAELVRVLAPGGRLGITAWAPGQNAYAQMWTEAAGRYMEMERLNRAFHEIIPWDDRFSNESNLRSALEAAGLENITLTGRRYNIVVGMDDYLMLRELSVEGTLLRRSLADADWKRFRQDVSRAFRERCEDTIRYDREVHLVRGMKRLAEHSRERRSTKTGERGDQLL